jgi:hypothetical protein
MEDLMHLVPLSLVIQLGSHQRRTSKLTELTCRQGRFISCNGAPLQAKDTTACLNSVAEHEGSGWWLGGVRNHMFHRDLRHVRFASALHSYAT